MQNTVEISGSHGFLIVHRPTGHVVRRHAYEAGGAYPEVALFDPAILNAPTWAEQPAFDILDTSFWTTSGTYVPRLALEELHGEGNGWEWTDPILALPAPVEGECITICGNAWALNEAGDCEEYADADAGEHVDGWNVYLRFEGDKRHSWPFDLTHERDFDTREQAEAYASELAAAFPAAEVHWY